LDNWVFCRIYKKVDKNSKRCETRNHVEDPLSPQPQIINGEGMEMEMEMSTLFDPMVEFDNKYSIMQNVYGVSHNGMVHSQLQAVRRNEVPSYPNIGHPQAIGARASSMPLLPDSLLESRYIDESTIHPDDLYNLKAFERSLYDTYQRQFPPVENFYPYLE
ncbi:PREDICTED: NAC domain-containing, partial [Prunus dulcis]